MTGRCIEADDATKTGADLDFPLFSLSWKCSLIPDLALLHVQLAIAEKRWKDAEELMGDTLTAVEGVL